MGCTSSPNGHFLLFGGLRAVRIRTLKPEFWQDEKLAPLPPIDRLVFLGLISMADDHGRILDNPRWIDAFIFGSTEEHTRESLATLSRLGRIRRGTTANGQTVIQITNWTKHQKVDRPSSRAIIPEIVEAIEVTEPSRDPRESVASPTRDPRATTLDPGPWTLDQRAAPNGTAPPPNWTFRCWDLQTKHLGATVGLTGKKLGDLHRTYGLPRLLAALGSFRAEAKHDPYHANNITLGHFVNSFAIWDAKNDLDDPAEWAALQAHPARLTAHYEALATR